MLKDYCLLNNFQQLVKNCAQPRGRSGRAFASHAGDRGSIPGRDRPKS